jgi:Integrase core domain
VAVVAPGIVVASRSQVQLTEVAVRNAALQVNVAPTLRLPKMLSGQVRARVVGEGARDGKFPDLFDAILADAGMTVVLSGVRMPRMNSIMERWVQTCRHEPLDRTLIWNQRHLLHALREFEHFYNEHRPHQGSANARPLHPLPVPITDPQQITRLDIRRRQRLGGILHEYEHAA